MKGKSKKFFFWLKPMGITQEKGWENHQKVMCAYEGGYVDTKRKSEVFWLKPMGITLGERLENHDKSNLCLWRAICAHEGEK